MWSSDSGKGAVHAVRTSARLDNFGDLWQAHHGTMRCEDVRSITLDDAVVDTDCLLIGLPQKLIERLGLHPTDRRRFLCSHDARERTICSPVRLTIQDRQCTMDVMEVPDDCPVLIGQLPLEHLDFVIDPREQKLIGNPAHGGEHIYEMY